MTPPLPLLTTIGIVHLIDRKAQMSFQRYVLMDGDGDSVKPFKAEWMTVRDGNLVIGSIGMEWSRNGTVLHRDAEFVKEIDPRGTVRSIDWGPRYARLRQATNTTLPGYLQHEAVAWHASTRQWFVLPRRASTSTPFSPLSDLRMGTNKLLVVDELFNSVRVVQVGPREPDWGFTSLAVLPDNESIVALKVRETANGYVLNNCFWRIRTPPPS